MISITDANLWVLAPEIVLVLTALLGLLIIAFAKGEPRRLVGDLSLAGVVGAGVATYLAWGGTGTFQGMAAADGFALFWSFVFLAGAALTVLLVIDFGARHPERQASVFPLLLLATAGMILMGRALNLVVLFVALEIVSISFYVLVSHLRDEPRSSEAGIKYLLLGGFASAFLLYGIALTYGATGSFVFQDIGAAVMRPAGLAANPLLAGGLMLILVGFAFKVALVPFQMWTPDVYEGAPTPITAFMSVAVKAAGFAALLRVLLIAFPAWQGQWGLLVAILAALTMTWGNLAAIRQGSVKRMLAYSSIAHAGYIAVGLAAAGDAGVRSVAFYLASYTLMNIGAFAVVAALGREGSPSEALADYAGLAQRRPWVAAAMTVFLLSLAGIPLTSGFLGKVYLFSAAVQEGLVWLAAIGVINAVISAYFYLRVVAQMYLAGEPADLQSRTTAPLAVSIAVAAVGTILLGVYPAPLLDLIRVAMTAITGS